MENLSNTHLDIAIIGISCRVPGANNWREFWKNLVSSKESIKIDSSIEKENKKYIAIDSSIDGKDLFDASFFDYNKNEAALMNPRYRIFHQSVWEALEDSGYTPESVDGKISLYAGCNSDFNWMVYANFMNRNKLVDDFTLRFISGKEHLSSLVSYKLNLNGPVYSIDSACSTSLASVHLACKDLIHNESNLAIAGGISLNTYSESGYFYQEGSILSEDGHCRTFDKQASGAVPSEGVGIVILKKLDQAIKDKDHIYAVIKSSAVNNDGNRKVGYAAPSVRGQVECIKEAYSKANIDYNTIDYIEAHGTATKLGDMVEVAALNEAFYNDTSYNCSVGSVKTNIGHTDYASGVIGLIKAALSLENKQLPPSINFESNNPKIDFGNGPFKVNNELKNLSPNNKDLYRIGVSSFGIGGTNVHTVLEEAPEVIDSESKLHSLKSVMLSAKTKASLSRNIKNITSFIEKEKNVNLDDLSYSLAVGRKHFKYRKRIQYNSLDELLKNLRNQEIGLINNKPSISIFLSNTCLYSFDVVEELYFSFPIVKETIDHCFDLIKKRTKGKADFSTLFIEGTSDNRFDTVANNDLLTFAVQYSVIQFIKSLGITIDHYLSYGIGELIALCADGVLDIEDTIKMILARDYLINDKVKGETILAMISEEVASKYCTNDISLAAINSIEEIMFSGPAKQIEKLFQELIEDGILCVKLEENNTSIVRKKIGKEKFKIDFEKIQWQKPSNKVISCYTSDIIKQEDITFSDYWIDQTFGTFNFSRSINKLMKMEKQMVILDLGANLFSQNVRRAGSFNKKWKVFSVLTKSKKKNKIDMLCDSFEYLWEKGVDVLWSKYYEYNKRNKIPLPTYSFDLQKYSCIADIDFDQIFNLIKTTKETPKTVKVANVKEIDTKTAKVLPKGDMVTNRLISLYKEVLDGEVLPTDNFFKIGGNSLNGLLLCEKINQEFEVKITVEDFFDTESIGDMGLLIQKLSGNLNRKTIRI